MARPPACRSLYWNSLSIYKDELARAVLGAPIDNSGIPSQTLIMSSILILALALVVALAPTKVTVKYTDKNL